jgi:signal transduction histidine kinase
MGLLGMRERALALGGVLDLVSAPGQGTRINLSIPIKFDRRRVDHDPTAYR